MTTDAIFSAIGNAITQFGGQNLRFDEIHLASTTLHPSQLTFAEIEALSRRYVHVQTNVHFHTPNNQHASYKFHECKNARSRIIDKMIENNSTHKIASKL